MECGTDCLPMSFGGILTVLAFATVCMLFALRYRWSVALSLPLLLGWRQALEQNNPMPDWAILLTAALPIVGAVVPRAWLRRYLGAPA